MIVNISEAKTNLSKLIDKVYHGEKVVIAKNNFTCEDAVLLRDLSFQHRDPFDRMLIAQSIENKMPIVTDDINFHGYDCTII